MYIKMKGALTVLSFQTSLAALPLPMLLTPCPEQRKKLWRLILALMTSPSLTPAPPMHGMAMKTTQKMEIGRASCRERGEAAVLSKASTEAVGGNRQIMDG